MKRLVWVIGLAAVAQTQRPEDFKISTDVNRVLLAVSVKDPDGGFVSGLHPDNFVVYENGRPQAIKYFSSDDVPVSVGLVLDNSGSMRSKRPETNLAALQFLHASNPKDEVFVVNFNDTPKLGLPTDVAFSDDRNQLKMALDSARPQGKTSLYDAIEMALDHLEKGKHDKKAIIVISDGGDNASRSTLDAVLDKARRSNAIVYTVGIYDDTDPDKHPGVLKKLAAITGGEMFRPEQLSDIRNVTGHIARDIRTQYTLGYAPSDDTRDGTYHRIRVVASAPGRGKLKVRTREGYIAPSTGAQASEKQMSGKQSAATGAPDAAGSNPK